MRDRGAAFCLAYLLGYEQDKMKIETAKFIITSFNIYFAGRNLIMTQGSKLLASLALLKEVADPIFGDNDFQVWANKELGLSKYFFKYWDYINALEVTKASTSSIVGVVTKNDWFDSFYTNWKVVQANEALNNKISKSTVTKLVEVIEGVKKQLDNENIVY